jgi:hypothetical protein
MTICIAAITNWRDRENRGRRIFMVSDRKMSHGFASNDNLPDKCLWLPENWMAMVAGNDVPLAIPIRDHVTYKMEGQPNDLPTWMAAFEEAYQQQLSAHAEAKILGRWQLSMKQFYESGRVKFGDDVFDQICAAIERIKLDVTFLVCGFDDEDAPHIFTVRNPGIAECHDMAGFWAIGSGDYAALTMLGFFGQSEIANLAHTIYHVYAAKFMAENATDVGKRSFAWLMTPRSNEPLNLKLADEMRAIWREHFKNAMPPTAHEPIIREIELADGEMQKRQEECEAAEAADRARRRKKSTKAAKAGKS